MPILSVPRLTRRDAERVETISAARTKLSYLRYHVDRMLEASNGRAGFDRETFNEAGYEFAKLHRDLDGWMEILHRVVAVESDELILHFEDHRSEDGHYVATGGPEATMQWFLTIDECRAAIIARHNAARRQKNLDTARRGAETRRQNREAAEKAKAAEAAKPKRKRTPPKS